MTRNKGFSLLEISVVIFIMGLTITALLQMLDWSNIRYREISKGWKERACLTEIRLWLRDQTMHSDIRTINLDALRNSVKFPVDFLVDEVRVIPKDAETFFIRIGYFDDRNRNGKPEKAESSSRLFCFRRRSA